jgi:hypothetical protein
MFDSEPKCRCIPVGPAVKYVIPQRLQSDNQDVVEVGGATGVLEIPGTEELPCNNTWNALIRHTTRNDLIGFLSADIHDPAIEQEVGRMQDGVAS